MIFIVALSSCYCSIAVVAVVAAVVVVAGKSSVSIVGRFFPYHLLACLLRSLTDLLYSYSRSKIVLYCCFPFCVFMLYD